MVVRALGTPVPAVRLGERLLFEKRQEEREQPSSTLDDLPLGNGERGVDPRRGKHAVGVVMAVAGQADLLEVVGALRGAWRPRATFCTAGRSSPIRTAMIAMTTSSSISVKALLRYRQESVWMQDMRWILLVPNGRLISLVPLPLAAAAFGSGDACQIFTVPSRLAEAIHLPSGLKATAWTQLVWPRRTWVSVPGPSQTLTVLSVLPQASRRLSRPNATHWTAPVGSCKS